MVLKLKVPPAIYLHLSEGLPYSTHRLCVKGTFKYYATQNFIYFGHQPTIQNVSFCLLIKCVERNI